MTDYNDGNWHGWAGGKCPVHPQTKVDVLFEDSFLKGWFACDFHFWSKNRHIIFRVVEQYKEPREFWLYTNECGNWRVSNTLVYGAIHVREVVE